MHYGRNALLVEKHIQFHFDDAPAVLRFAEPLCAETFGDFVKAILM